MTKHGFKNRRQILCMTNVCAKSQVTRTSLYSCSFKAYKGTCRKIVGKFCAKILFSIQDKTKPEEKPFIFQSSLDYANFCIINIQLGLRKLTLGTPYYCYTM